MADTDGKYMFEVVNATVTDVSVKLTVWSDDIDDGGLMTLFTQRFNRTANRYEEDQATFDESDRIARDAFGVGLQDIIDDWTCIKKAEFEGYLNDKRGTVTLEPPRVYIRADKLDNAGVKAIKALDMPIETTYIAESKNHGVSQRTGNAYAMAQFDCFIPVEVKGEEKMYRISQFVVPGATDDDDDITLKTKYIDDYTQDLYKDYDTGKFDDADDARKMLRMADRNLERQREELAERFEKVVGRSIDDLIETGDPLTVEEIEVRVVPGNNSKYIVAHIRPFDEDAPF